MIKAGYQFKQLFQNYFKRDTNKLLSKPVFGKPIQSEINERHLGIVINKKKHASLISFEETNFISENLQLNEKDKGSRVKLDKPTFTGQSCSNESEQFLYAFKYEYIRYRIRVKNVDLNYMDTGIHYPLTELNHVYKDISGNVEKCFDVSNYDEKRKISLLV